jgi:feruloyl esterase
MYHGWADGNVPAGDAIEYYERVTLAVGGSDRIGDFFRLFLVPGMGHCSGGDGPNTLDTMSGLEQWVEHGKAPEQMIASKSATA